MNDFDKEIAEIYKDMELEMIKSMKRNLGLHIAEEAKTGIEYPQWQAIKIREMRKYQRQNKSLLKNSRRGMNKDIKDHIRDEMKQGSLHEMKRFKKAKDAGYKSAVAMKDSFFKINTKKVDSLINSVHSDFARADQAILRMMNDTYRSTIFKFGMYVSNGVYTEKQAYDAAVKDFLSRGLNCIEYKDGRRVDIADYTSMAIRTVNQRAYMAGEGEVRKQLGETLVIISHHATSCPLCQPFENKVLIDDVYSGGKADDGDYMLLSQAMAEGLFHPRCRHGLGTYYPELEDIVHYDTEENRVNEYGTDKLNQAHVENMIQKYKRLTDGSIDPENIAKYQAKLDEWENKKAQLGVANSENSGIILARNLDRKSSNTGVFSNLGVTMQKKEVKRICEEYGFDVKGLTFKIQRSEHLLNSSYYGSTDYDNIGRIDLFPNAFQDEEELIKTIIHEKCHVEQLKRYGKKYCLEHLADMEAEAYQTEEEIFKKLTKGEK